MTDVRVQWVQSTNRYTVKLRPFADSYTVAEVYDNLNGGRLVHETDFKRNPTKVAKKARKWIKQRELADRIAEGFFE